MIAHNASNERVKRQYFAYLREAKRHDESTVDAVAKALARFESDTKFRDFRTFHIARRVPDVAMRPVIDPAGWTSDSLGPVEDWAYRICAQDQDEIVAAVEAFRERRLPLAEVSKDSFEWNHRAQSKRLRLLDDI